MKVLITGAGCKIGMVSAFSLTKEGFVVIGTDERSLPFKVRSRHLKSYYLHAPYNSGKFCEDLLTIIKKEKPDVLIPFTGTMQISANKKILSDYVNLAVPDYESYSLAYNKKKVYAVCEEAGISVPKRYSDMEAEQILIEKNSKLVIKPDFDAGGAKGLRIVQSREELRKAKESITNRYNGYLIEDFIPGSDSMRAVQLVFNKMSKIVACFILKKVHQWPVTGGVTAYAESTHEWKLIDFVIPFFKKCKWEGPAEAEIIIDERDGRPKLIEINPRFAGSISFAIQCGVNFPSIVCRAALNNINQEITREYEAGRFYINWSYYRKSVLKEFLSSRNKHDFIFQIINELKRKKVGTAPDKKDLLVYLFKALSELKQSI